MNLHEYQGEIDAFARYPEVHSVRYCVLGLFGEAGEIANQVKKIWRDDDGRLTEDRAVKLRDELGDVLWYATRLAHHLGLIVGTFEITIGQGIEPLDIEAPQDLFEATEQLGVLSGLCFGFSLGEEMEEAHVADFIGTLFNTIANVANFLETDLEEVAQLNVDKLTGRVERGTLGGSGDGR